MTEAHEQRGLLDQVRPASTEPIRWVRCWADGGVHGSNPSPLGVYWSVCVEVQGQPPVMLRRGSKEYSTNNEAEWLALREAIRYVLEHHPGMPAVIHSDSKLAVNQFNGIYALREARLRGFLEECRELAAAMQNRLIVLHVPRAQIVKRLGH